MMKQTEIEDYGKATLLEDPSVAEDELLDAFRDPTLPREIREALSELEGYRDAFNGLVGIRFNEGEVGEAYEWDIDVVIALRRFHARLADSGPVLAAIAKCRDAYVAVVATLTDDGR